MFGESMETHAHNIAIVIIGRNEGERLVRCIHSVLAQNVLVVYVDSASADSSIAVAKKAGIAFVELDNSIPLSAARARNAGYDWIRKTGKDIYYIHFIDGDCELDPDWLEKAVQCLEQEGTIGAVCGRLREKHKNKSMFSKLSDMGWYIKPGEIEACGGIVTIRRDVFEKLTGFDDSFIAGEEPEFYYRLRKEGYKIFCIDEEMGTHDGDITNYRQWFIRSSRTGFAYGNAEMWGYWHKERRSLIIWGGIFPFLFIAGLIWYLPLSIAVILLYIIQIIRNYNGLEIPYSRREKLLMATFFMVDKFSEFFGYLKYKVKKWSGKKQTLIEYKKN